MNNKKIYSGALCLEEKKKTVKPSELKDLDSHLDKAGDQLFSLLTEVVAIPQVSLECS